MARFSRIVIPIIGVILMPAWALAQSTITGVVKDTSGAVLPGVTVEAASPVLIEKVRTAVTDGTGQYRILDLRPGAYTVTFTLTGFGTFKRDGLELPADFVSTVNAEMRVGALAETVTVTGESPIVDVQSVTKRRTLDLDLIQSIPSARGYASITSRVAVLFVTTFCTSTIGLSPVTVTVS